MKKPSSKKIIQINPSIYKSPILHIKRGSSKKLTKPLEPQVKSSKKVQEDRFECMFCKIGLQFRDLFKHLEIDCENFEKGKQLYKNIDSKKKVFISKLNFNAIFTPVTETPDPKFESLEFQEHPNLNLVTSSKNKGETKKIQFIKEIQIPDLALGQIHLKSNQFCVFGLNIKNRYVRQFAAYRVDDYNVQIIDIATNQDCALLKGHTDLVTEIRYFKSRKDYNLLFTCSYDGNVFIWDINTFTRLKSINFKTWTLSVVIAPHFDNELVFVCGGYSKASPIKAYDLESGDFRFELSLQGEAIPVILEKYQQGRNHLLFCGTDSENPGIFIFDYDGKQLIKSFSIKSVVTAFTLYSSTSSNLMLYSSDYYGTIREIDLYKMKLNTEFSVGQNLLDLLMWDDYFMICCGEKTNSLKFLVRHKHKISKAYPNLHDKVVLNLQKMYFMGVGNCFFTLSADKTIKIFKI